MRHTLVIGFALLCSPERLEPQAASLWLDAGAGQARWATGGATTDRLTYGVIGLRGAWIRNRVGVRARFGAGQGGGSSGSAAWLSGDAGAWIRHAAGRFGFGLDGEGFGIRYDHVGEYRATGARIVPSIAWRSSRWAIRLRGEAAAGSWRQETDEGQGPPLPIPVPVPGGGRTVTRGSLRLAGSGLDLRHGGRGWWVQASPMAFRASGRVPDAWQAAAEGEVGIVAGPATVSAGARWLSAVTVNGEERTTTVGMLGRVRMALGDAWAFTLHYDGRSWDPMHAVQRGTMVHAGIEWRAAPGASRQPSAAEIGPWTGTGRTVRFRVRSPGSSRVELVGDFSGWSPVPMTRLGTDWEAVVVIAPGTHQFAFLIDGDRWMVPPHAPGIVTDGWGRQNATIVITEPGR